MKWKYKIEIKKYLFKGKSDNAVLKTCNNLIPQLEVIFEKEKSEKYIDDNFTENFISNFQYLIESLKYIQDSIKNNIHQIDKWYLYLNKYLNYLYDIADTTIIKRNLADNQDEVKFLWID